MKNVVIRISSLIAIVAGIAVFGLGVTRFKDKLAGLNNRLAAQSAAREKAESDLVNTRLEANKTVVALKRTAGALEEKSAEVAAQDERIAKLNDDAKKLREERNEALEKLAAYRFSMTPEQVANAAKQIRSLEDSLTAVNEENAMLARSIKNLRKFAPVGDRILLPPDLSTKVLTVDPKWRFVVLDAGEDQGVLEQGELLVSRGGKLVAKVRVSRVEKNRSVANVLDGWDFAEMMEGDRAIPADPKSL